MSKRRKIILSSAAAALFALSFCGSANAGQEQDETAARTETQAEESVWLSDISGLRQAILEDLKREDFAETESETASESEGEFWVPDSTGLRQAILGVLEQDGFEEAEIGIEEAGEIETETETEPQPVSRTAGAVGHEGGLVYVTVTLDPDGTIAEVRIDDCSSQTDTIGQIAAPAVARQIEKAQSVQVDGVTGATDTSDAVKEAAEEAIREAKSALQESR